MVLLLYVPGVLLHELGEADVVGAEAAEPVQDARLAGVQERQFLGHLQAAALAPGEGRPRVPAQRQQQLVDHPAARRRAGRREGREGCREGRVCAAAAGGLAGGASSPGSGGGRRWPRAARWQGALRGRLPAGPGK